MRRVDLADPWEATGSAGRRDPRPESTLAQSNLCGRNCLGNFMKCHSNASTELAFMDKNGTPDRESQCMHPGHASFQWDAAHSGSQRSQCKVVHFTMERRWSGMISPNDFSKTWNIESP